MYKMWEILERANTGPFCEEEEFLYKIFMPKMKEVIKKYGIHSSAHADPNTKLPVQLAPTFVEHRTPGFGDSNWADIITELRRGGFTGSIDIEGWHDPIYEGELEMTGQVRALNYLKACRGGDWVPGPVV